MTPETPFYRSIAATPADDAPRLVFADWLDEHEQPERAELIRVQCKSGSWTRAVGYRNGDWIAAVDAPEHLGLFLKQDGFSGVGKWEDGTAVVYSRGFPSAVTLSSGQFFGEVCRDCYGGDERRRLCNKSDSLHFSRESFYCRRGRFIAETLRGGFVIELAFETKRSVMKQKAAIPILPHPSE